MRDRPPSRLVQVIPIPLQVTPTVYGLQRPLPGDLGFGRRIGRHRFCGEAGHGLSQPPPDAARCFTTPAPQLAVFPRLAVFLTVTAFSPLGDGLPDALDPQGAVRRGNIEAELRR